MFIHGSCHCTIIMYSNVTFCFQCGYLDDRDAPARRLKRLHFLESSSNRGAALYENTWNSKLELGIGLETRTCILPGCNLVAFRNVHAYISHTATHVHAYTYARINVYMSQHEVLSALCTARKIIIMSNNNFDLY